MKSVVIIDGQGGRMGAAVVAGIKAAALPCSITAIGTNSVAAAAMLKAGADAAATGENPVIVACRSADFIIGPLGIVIADSLLGEITPAMAAAVGQSRAVRLLLPVNICSNLVVGIKDQPFGKFVSDAVEKLAVLLSEGSCTGD